MEPHCISYREGLCEVSFDLHACGTVLNSERDLRQRLIMNTKRTIARLYEDESELRLTASLTSVYSACSARLARADWVGLLSPSASKTFLTIRDLTPSSGTCDIIRWVPR